ncbi:MAG: hypothetical protein PVG22_01385 [Chromatiales bacterium]
MFLADKDLFLQRKQGGTIEGGDNFWHLCYRSLGVVSQPRLDWHPNGG